MTRGGASIGRRARRWVLPAAAAASLSLEFARGGVRTGRDLPALDVAPDASASVTSGPAQATPAACPADMVPVQGSYCPEVRERCLGWIDYLQRCREFARPTVCTAPRRALSFCMDRYEWPNREGALPEVMVSFAEAQSLCREQGKRLCTESEWTFACEGEESLPYPYGYVRDPAACVIDHPRRRINVPMLLRNLPAMLSAEVSRLYEASPSGAMPGCVSPFGVHDLTGNVDEWAVNESGVPYVSLLKGGWWSRAKARCRTATKTHYQHFRYYEIGFRCCADPRPG